MTEEELKVKFDYIQGIFNRCINYACQILIDSIIVKVRYLNGEQADELLMEKGVHDLEVEFFDRAGLARFRVEWCGGGIPPRTIVGPPYLLKAY